MSEILGETILSAAGDDPGSPSETILRKRNPWNSIVSDSIDLLADVDELDDEEEEDGVGCPLPSTPEDNQLLEAEVDRYIVFVLSFFVFSQLPSNNKSFAKLKQKTKLS